MTAPITATPTLDDIHSDIGNIIHLIDEAVSQNLDVSHDKLETGEKASLNRAVAFSIIARDMLKRIDDAFWQATIADRKEKRGAGA